MSATTMQPQTLELRKKMDEASGAFGAGMAAWERGELSNHERGVLQRRMRKAETAFRDALYAEQRCGQ